MLSTFIRILEVLFIVGAIGSAFVIMLTFAEDLIEVWRDDKPKSRTGPDKAS